MVQIQRWRLEEGQEEMKHGMGGKDITGMEGMKKKKRGMRSRMKMGLAALAEPRDKITRADVIAGAMKNKRKKSM